MKKRHTTAICFLFLFYTAILSAQDMTLPYSRANDGLASFILENGLEVYLLPTSETPVAHIIFAVKGGYSSQTPETTGVPELYSRLFFNACETGLDAFTVTGASELYASCYSDVVHYSLQCPDISLFDVLTSLSQCALNPLLSNPEIQRAHKELLEEKIQWADSVSGYINSATDTMIFQNAPWAFDTGIFPESFQRSTTEEMRGMLAAHVEKYYTPNNCALFIETSLNSSAVLEKVKELFGRWRRGAYTVDSPTGSLAGVSAVDSAAEIPKYVLVSDEFSSDFNQFIIQYVHQGDSDMTTLASWQTAAVVLQQNQDLSYALTTGGTGIEDYSLYNISYTQASAVPRLIFQCLSDSRKQNPVQQATALFNILNQGSWYNTAAIDAAKEQIASQAVSARTKASQLLEAIALNWAYGGTSYFYDFPIITANLTTSQVTQVTTTDAVPMLFILLHTKNWNTWQKELMAAGFNLITKDQAPWYTKETYAAQRALALGGETGHTETAGQMKNTEGKSISSFGDGGSTISQDILTNGIPLLMRKEPRSQGVTIRVTIQGGEAEHSPSLRGLETATVSAVVENIRKNISAQSFDASVTGETGLWHSSITITTAVPYAEDTIAALGKALFFETIPTSQADGILFNMQYQWRLKQGSLGFQMLCHAMQYCYANTLTAKFYTSSGDLLPGVSIAQLRENYAALLNPERYCISVIAQNPSQYVSQLDAIFGSILQPPVLTGKKTTKPTDVTLSVPDITRYVTLNHIFTTDIKAEDAGPRPLHLIPTTKFDDPVHYFFAAPSITSDEYPLFMALLFELEEQLNRVWEPGVELHLITPENPLIQVIFKNVPQKTDVFPIFASAFNALQDPHTEEQIRLLKTRAINRLFTDNAQLMEQSWLYCGDASRYTTQYALLESAQWEQFDQSLDILRPKFNILELLSDTRKTGQKK